MYVDGDASNVVVAKEVVATEVVATEVEPSDTDSDDDTVDTVDIVSEERQWHPAGVSYAQQIAARQTKGDWPPRRSTNAAGGVTWGQTVLLPVGGFGGQGQRSVRQAEAREALRDMLKLIATR